MKWLRRKLGMVHVYTGDGKGKTTAALGLGMRASGHGYRVCMVQFMKGNMQYGEQRAKLKNFEIREFGRKEFVNKERPAKVDIEHARKGLKFARRVLTSGDYDLVILDEINVALDWKLVNLEDVLALIRDKSPNTELVLTGRYAHPQVMEMADYVSEIREIKHPFQKGILSVKGVEH